MKQKILKQQVSDEIIVVRRKPDRRFEVNEEDRLESHADRFRCFEIFKSLPKAFKRDAQLSLFYLRQNVICTNSCHKVLRWFIL
jgi:hypothetical protein